MTLDLPHDSYDEVSIETNSSQSDVFAYGYWPLEGFESELNIEVEGLKASKLGPLTVVPLAPKIHPLWQRNIWINPQIISYTSISDAAKKLKALNKLWVAETHTLHRRTQLILENLPKLKERNVEYLGQVPPANLGAFFLLDENTLVASSQCVSPFPHGDFSFSRVAPEAPSRAYLKLWEFFTTTGVYPKPNETVADFGSCPGGWTWVLSELGCQVISLDKAPLADSLNGRKNIEYRSRDAFKVKPEDLPELDWFFSDIICEPKKLFDFFELWNSSKRVKHFLLTIKFKGKTDFDVINQFRKKDGAKLLHLSHNKHELTFFYESKS